MSIFLTPVISVMASEAKLDWSLCADSSNIPARPVVFPKLTLDEIHITADNADVKAKETSTLDGNVEIMHNDQHIKSNHAQFNRADDVADLQGNIQYWDKSLYLEADKAHIEFKADTGQFENTKYVLKDTHGHGQSANLEMKSNNEINLKNADYSTCDPKNKLWSLSVKEINFDRVKEWGSAKNIIFKIKDMPIFYSPYISFPLNKKRKTGFLMPSVENSNRHGFQTQTPFYWNIAPQTDATLTPRLLADSGVMLMGEFRHVYKNGDIQIRTEYLPSDKQFDDKNRNLLGLKHQYKFASNGKFSLNYNRVSDKQYFEDFGASLGITSTRFLQQRGDISYVANWWGASMRLENYQLVTQTTTVAGRPYKRLPQINFNAHSPNGTNKFYYDLNGAFTYFDRDNDVSFVDNVLGTRLNLLPSVSYPYRTASMFVTPKISLHFTQYDLHNTNTFESSPSRLLPVVSIDSGIFLERDFSLFGKRTLQTLEPKLFYLYIPKENQDNLPIFDTDTYDFSFDSLFREYRFSGNDRVGDANQLTLALTSHLIDHNTGKEKAYLNLGKIYYLDNREVILPNNLRIDGESSPFIAAFGVKLSNHWGFRSELHWNPNSNTTEKLLAQIQYKPTTTKTINLSYRVRDTSNAGDNLANIEQSNLSFHWPFNQSWSIVGRWNYATAKNKSLEIFGGIEYDGCCFAFKTITRRFLTNINGDFDTGVFFYLEFKGLADTGHKTIDFLRQRIPGYEGNF